LERRTANLPRAKEPFQEPTRGAPAAHRRSHHPLHPPPPPGQRPIPGTPPATRSPRPMLL